MPFICSNCKSPSVEHFKRPNYWGKYERFIRCRNCGRTLNLDRDKITFPGMLESYVNKHNKTL